MTGPVQDDITPLPHWVSSRLLPLLTGDEAKLYLYILLRTWGMRQKSARIARSQILNGKVKDGQYVDYGAGLTKKATAKALKALHDYRVIRVVGRWSWSENLPWELAPAWEDKIDTDGLKARRRDLDERNAKRASNFGDKLDIDVDSPPAGALAINAPKLGAEAQRLFEEEFGVVAPAGDLDRVMERAIAGEAMTKLGNGSARQERMMSKLNIPKYVLEGGVTPGEWGKMSDVFLRLTGQDAIANINDSDVAHLADKALAEAHDCATLAVASGARTAADLDGLETYWLGSWQYKKAVSSGDAHPVPSMGTLRNLLNGYMASRKQASAKPATPVAEERRQATYVASELDGWKPKKKRD